MAAVDFGVSGGDQTPQIDELVELLWERCVGNPSLHAVQQTPGTDGKCRYISIKSPVTKDLLRQHCAGKVTIGSYVLLPSNRIRYAVCDWDDRSAATLEQIRAAKAWLLRFGIQSLVEFSGSKGFHLWVFFDEPVPAWKVRLAFKRMQDDLREKPG